MLCAVATGRQPGSPGWWDEHAGRVHADAVAVAAGAGAQRRGRAQALSALATTLLTADREALMPTVGGIDS